MSVSVAIVQARLGSSRFPRKVLEKIGAQTAIEMVIDRLNRCAEVDQVVVAIPDSSIDDPLEDFLLDLGVVVKRGSTDDVLDRYQTAAAATNASLVVRITADCPLVDPAVVDEAVRCLRDGEFDYVRTSEDFPDGLDVEVFTVQSLEKAWANARDEFDREHVTPFMRRDQTLRRFELAAPEGMSGLRVTLDYPEDLEVIRQVVALTRGGQPGLREISELAAHRPEVFEGNSHFRRNEGAQMSSGQKVWRRAKRRIPGGSLLLSKRAEMFLPEAWPAYFDRAVGCEVWDLDQRHFFDVGWMSIGTNTLGYGYSKVDDSVRNVITKGNLSTLNCQEEVLLAERLCELHPWAEMARFTRSGGEVCAVAIRIARAASGKDGVAFCGYHGWHDWYLAANLAEDSALDGHLLPGLEPRGVPRGLIGSSRPFLYNDLESLRRIVAEGSTGVVIMEVERSMPPQPGFLEGVRDLCNENGIVLVFDECTSGFRQVLGGLHLVYGVEPDLATFGKTLGNGYAINAVIGRESVMQAAQSTFISSTFWTERIGPTAALATLEAMADEESPRRVHEIGGQVRSRWHEVALRTGLPITTGGIPALSTYSIDGFDPNAVKTFVIQEMLKRGFLAGPVLYASISHTPEIIDDYFEALEGVWRLIAECDSPSDLANRLDGPMAHGGFQRLA
jgi:glutamate-1-semialdehyde 2,1-aminomutase